MGWIHMAMPYELHTYPSQADYQTSWAMFLAQLDSSRAGGRRCAHPWLLQNFGAASFLRHVRIQNSNGCGFNIHAAKKARFRRYESFIYIYIHIGMSVSPPSHMLKKKEEG